MSDDQIAESLGLRPLSEDEKKVPDDTNVVSNNSLTGTIVQGDESLEGVLPPESDEDYELARANMANLILKGEKGLDEMFEIAKQSENPRAFEVFANLLKTLMDGNEKLLDIGYKRLEQARKEIKQRNSDGPSHKGTTKVTNNTLFVGSTKELLQELEDMRKKDA